MKFFVPTTSLRSYDLALNLGLAMAAVCIALMFYAGIIRPIHMHISRLESQSCELKDLIYQTSQISVQREKLQQELMTQQTSLERLEARLPTAARESDFLAQMCELAASENLEIADYQPGAVSARETHHELEVSVSLRGDYSAICQLLRQADELPRLCRLVRLEMTSAEAGEKLIANLTYRIYFTPHNLLQIAKKDSAR